MSITSHSIGIKFTKFFLRLFVRIRLSRPKPSHRWLNIKTIRQHDNNQCLGCHFVFAWTIATNNHIHTDKVHSAVDRTEPNGTQKPTKNYPEQKIQMIFLNFACDRAHNLTMYHVCISCFNLKWFWQKLLNVNKKKHDK